MPTTSTLFCSSMAIMPTVVLTDDMLMCPCAPCVKKPKPTRLPSQDQGTCCAHPKKCGDPHLVMTPIQTKSWCPTLGAQPPDPKVQLHLSSKILSLSWCPWGRLPIAPFGTRGVTTGSATRAMKKEMMPRSWLRGTRPKCALALCHTLLTAPKLGKGRSSLLEMMHDVDDSTDALQESREQRPDTQPVCQ